MNRHNGYSKREALALKEERGALKEKEIQFNVHVKPMKRFLKFYVEKRGFQNGIHGLIFSVLFAWVHFMNWMKYWELTREARHPESRAQSRGEGSHRN